jgi:hypothetical protein
MTHRAEQLLQPRSFVLAGNEEALVLQSTTPETRITFLNSVSAASPNLFPRFGMSFKDEAFLFTSDANVIGSFQRNRLVPSKQEFSWRGTTLSCNIELFTPVSKGIILHDYNVFSDNQFAGFGVESGSVIYQLPARTTRHVFRAAAYDGANTEWMRLQESATGIVQLGIGTDAMAMTDALTVQGNSRVIGNLFITGQLITANASFLSVDPETQRLPLNKLPSNLPLLDNQNKISESLLPTSYNFQFMKAQKNVGIGTRVPKQKLHVWGSTVVSERVGIGSEAPTARLDIVETSGTIAAARIHTIGGSDALRVTNTASTTPTLIVAGTHGGVGINTSVVSVNDALVVGGNTRVLGDFACRKLTLTDRFEFEGINVTSSVTGIVFRSEEVQEISGATATRVFSRARFDFESGLSTNTISSYSTGLVRFFNTSIEVDGDTILARPALVRSDMRHKHDIERIGDAPARLAGMRGYTYRMNDNGRLEAGVLAQEVLACFPEAVSTANPSCYAVRYDALIGLLLEGYHDLRKRLHELETRS